jgi:hypothetical protein
MHRRMLKKNDQKLTGISKETNLVTACQCRLCDRVVIMHESAIPEAREGQAIYACTECYVQTEKGPN